MHYHNTKTIVTLALFLAIITNNNNIFAQEKDQKDNEVETLFGDKTEHGGYGALYFGYTQISDRNSMTAGLKGAWIIDHSIGIGFAGTGFFTEIENTMLPNEDWSAITGGHGGLLIEPIIYGTKPIHISVPMIIGAGGVVYGSNRDYDYGFTPGVGINYNEYFDYYFVFEPGIELEFNLTQFFRLATGISYRITSDVNITRTKDEVPYEVVSAGDLRNFSVHLAFKFGKF